MPANLTPQYLRAEEKFKKANDDEEKLKALKEMLSLIPKHKGTEKLQADIKRKISNLRENLKNKKSIKRVDYSRIEKEGVARISLVGLPNSGKSTFINCVTSAKSEVASFPFTTKYPEVGMMEWEGIKFQLIDLPPLSVEYVEPFVFNVINSSDFLLIFVDLESLSPMEDIETIVEILKGKKIFLDDDNYKSLFLLNKIDIEDGNDNADVVEEFFGERFEFYRISALNFKDEYKNFIGGKIFKELGLIRIYTKEPGKKIVEGDPPFVLKSGSTVGDLALKIHKDVFKKFKFARAWGNPPYDGIRVTKDFILEDKMIIEIHI